MTMQTRDLAALLRIKHARAQRAATHLAQARDAAQRAEHARQQAHDSAASHDAARPAREAQIYAKLLAAPVTTAMMQAEAALLSGMVAYSAVLRDQAEAASLAKTASDDQAQLAARAHGAAQRAAEATKAMREQWTSLQAAADERRAEIEVEDQAHTIDHRS
jgi:hypothetical protein